MSESLKFPQYLTSIVSCIGALMTGVALGWSSPVEKDIKAGILNFQVTDDEFSWVVAMLPLGAGLACIPIGLVANVIGRKATLYSLSNLFLIGWLLLQFAQNALMLYLGRFVLGLACGAVCVVTPIYIAEIVEKEIRGICGNFFQLFLTIGSTSVNAVGAFAKFSTLNYFCIAIYFVEFGCMLFLPESLIFLVAKGQDEKARAALKFLRGQNYDAELELKALKVDVEQLAAKDQSLFAGFNNATCRRGLLIILGLMFFQQFCGINAVLFYAVTLFEQAGSSLEPKYAAIVICGIGFLTTLISGFFVDKLGRRLLLLLSGLFMAASTCVFGYYFHMHEQDENYFKNYGWLPLTTLCVFVVVFSFGFGPVPWILIGELFVGDVRAPAGAVTGTCNWFFAFLVSKTYVNVKSAIGTGVTFWIFSALTLLGVVFVFILVPETKGKSLQEIQDMLLKTNAKK